ISWLIVGIVGFRYIRSWDKRERIVRAALLHLSHTFTRVVSGVSPWHCCAWTFRALFVLSTRKTKSRRPPVCGRALLRSDNRVTVKHRGHSLANSDRCCQWQRLSFICRGDLRRQRFEKSQRSQRINRPAVPTKRSSPPAEKCGVCIGATVPSQA